MLWCTSFYLLFIILLLYASGVHVNWQLEVFKGVEGDVSVVHHSNDHGDISALERQQLDGSQVGNGTVETAAKKRTCYYINTPKTRQ